MEVFGIVGFEFLEELQYSFKGYGQGEMRTELESAGVRSENVKRPMKDSHPHSTTTENRN